MLQCFEKGGCLEEVRGQLPTRQVNGRLRVSKRYLLKLLIALNVFFVI